ncbi:MAG: hypothetical protein LBC92_03160 [Rickettsiales bacterium]|jgi:hypothetical protein|nr:hypothetical protein [Rickettsiales bacterium]
MVYNESDFIKSIEESFKAYKEKGARSTAKLKPIHKFIAETLAKIWGDSFDVCYLGNKSKEFTVKGKYSKEFTVKGKYYDKDIDITR